MAHLMVEVTDLLEAGCYIHQRLTVDPKTNDTKRTLYVQFAKPANTAVVEKFDLDTEMTHGLYFSFDLDAATPEHRKVLEAMLLENKIPYGII